MLGLILAGGMGIANAISGAQTRADQRKKLREQRDRNLALLDLQFNNAKDEANKNADKSDLRSTMNEGFIAANANNQLDMLDANMEQQGLEFNLEAMAAGQQKGNSLVQAAASGTRNSSMNTAIDLESAVNAAQLQAKENSADASNRYNLNSILTNFNNDVFNLQANRTDAYDLRHSYDEGGNNWNLYDLQRKNTKAGYDDAIDELQTNLWSVLSDFGSGAAQGYSIGSSLEGLWTDISGKLATETSAATSMSFDDINAANDYSKLGNAALNSYDIFGVGTLGQNISDLQSATDFYKLGNVKLNGNDIFGVGTLGQSLDQLMTATDYYKLGKAKLNSYDIYSW